MSSRHSIWIRAIVGLHLRESDAGMIVDGDEQEFPAGLADAVARITRDAVPGFDDAGKLFGVQIQQIAGGSMLIAHDRGAGRQISQTHKPRATQHPAHSGGRHIKAACNTGMGQAASTQLDDRQRAARGKGAWAQAGVEASRKPITPRLK